MSRLAVALLVLVVALGVAIAAASALTLTGPDSPRSGAHGADVCDLGVVYFHPVSTVDGSDLWVYWRIEASAFDAEACADSELRAKVAWDGVDTGSEPDGYYYMRIPTNEDLNKPTIVGATIMGVFGDAVDDICDPFNCYEVDGEGHFIVRYVYSSPTFDEEDRIDTLPDVAGHNLGETEWIITAADAPLVDF
ncbi:MAG: hypothetical protein QG597_3698 [Actinomycetota bacterium]|nr:hypothetical protein [Actinomycetota bacterium]